MSHEGLIPVNKRVSRGGKPHTQVYWVKPDEVQKAARLHSDQAVHMLGGSDAHAEALVRDWVSSSSSDGAFEFRRNLVLTGHMSEAAYQRDLTRHSGSGGEDKAYLEAAHQRLLHSLDADDDHEAAFANTTHALVVGSQLAHDPVVTLYRGVGREQLDSLRAANNGLVAVDSLSSWTDNVHVASTFAMFNDGAVIAARVPRNRIALSHRFETRLRKANEQEVVVMSDDGHIQYTSVEE